MGFPWSLARFSSFRHVRIADRTAGARRAVHRRLRRRFELGDEKAPPPARAQDFPKPGNQSLRELLADVSAAARCSRPRARSSAPASSGSASRCSRKDRSQITDASVAVYVAPAGGGPARGPYLARYESMAVTPQFQSRQTASDPNAAKSIYTTEIPFDKPGRWEVLGIARSGGKLAAASSAAGRDRGEGRGEGRDPEGGRHPAAHPHADGGERRAATSPRSTPGCRRRRCTTTTSRTCSARSRWC